MKSSYKVAMFLAVTLCVVVIFYYARQDSPGEGGGEVVKTLDDTTAPPPQATPTQPATRPSLVTSTTKPEPEKPNLTKDLLARLNDVRTEPTKPAVAPAPHAAEQPDVPELLIGGEPVETTTTPVTTTPAPVTPTTTTSTPPVRPGAFNHLNTTTATTPTPTPRPTNQPVQYTIKAGDTFGSIAREKLGEERYWVQIAQANPRVDPQRLQVGQIIRLPTREAVVAETTTDANAAAPAADESYTVRAGDTLSDVAQQYYNDPNLWRYIYNANRAKIGSDPGRIKAGMRLVIPPAPRAAE